MAMYHMHAQIISRSSGRSSVAAAAYRSGSKLTNKRDGITHDYSHKQGVVHSEIVLPDSAPRRWLDREVLWNDVERSERSANSQLAREIEYALPNEFDSQQQVAFAREFARAFADEGMIADFSIHNGKNGNPHVHMLLSMRPCDEGGFKLKSVNTYLVRDSFGHERYATSQELKVLGDGWAKIFHYKNGERLTQKQAAALGLNPTKDRRSKVPVQENRNLVDWNTPEKLVEWRKRLADMQNESLAAMGSTSHVDHRSYIDCGIEQLPTTHEGFAVRKAESAALAKAQRDDYEYKPVTQRRRQNTWIMEMNKRFADWMNRAKARLRSLLPKRQRQNTTSEQQLTIDVRYDVDETMEARAFRHASDSANAKEPSAPQKELSL